MVQQPPLLVGLVSDLFFTAPLEAAARALGWRVRWISSGAEFGPAAAAAPGPARPGEPLSGPSAGFIRFLVEHQPALVLVELSSASIPWPAWIAALKSSAATRRIPVLAFGPHTDLDLRARALDAGCDAVVAQGRLLTGLADLLEQHARQRDDDGLEAGCAGELSALARRGVELFNQRQFFEAHEELEQAWNREAGPARELYRSLLQVAVAYLQIERGNYAGALKMFLRLRQWLDPLPDACRGVDVAQLRADAEQARRELERLGPPRLAEFDRSLFRPVPWAESG